VKRQQGKLFARFVAAIDVSGRTRRKRRAAVLTVEQRQSRERRELAGRIRAARAIQAEAVHARHRPVIEDLKRQRREQVRTLKDRQRDGLRRDDLLLQAREAEREQDRAALLLQLEAWKRAQREAGDQQQAAASRLGQDRAGKDATRPQERTPARRHGGPSPAGSSRARRMRRS
jgi:hypothetical protein